MSRSLLYADWPQATELKPAPRNNIHINLRIKVPLIIDLPIPATPIRGPLIDRCKPSKFAEVSQFAIHTPGTKIADLRQPIARPSVALRQSTIDNRQSTIDNSQLE